MKPSRFGTVRGLLDCIDACEQRGIAMYGGGQYELGPGRPQIQRLASLFYADGPNDVAPSVYNEGGARPGLPTSPLSRAGRSRPMSVNLFDDVWRLRGADGTLARAFGDELGATLWGGTLYELGPGERICPYHWHFGEEEWLLVVAGSPTLRTPDGERVLRRGIVAVFRRGAEGAHEVRNDGDEPARVVFCSRPSPTRRSSSIPTAARSARRRLVSERRRPRRAAEPPEANLDYFDGEHERRLQPARRRARRRRSERPGLSRTAARRVARDCSARELLGGDAVRDAARREALAVPLGARLRGVPRRRVGRADRAHAGRRAGARPGRRRPLPAGRCRARTSC